MPKTDPAATWTRWLLLAVVVLVLDQATKIAALKSFAPGEILRLAPFAALTLAFNEGAAFSFLAKAGGWQRFFFIALALGVSAYLIHWMRQGVSRRVGWALGLILGGAVGNVIDRIWQGKVTDFILLHYEQYAWPVFNVADSAICVGAALLIIDSFTSKEKPLNDPRAA